MTSKRSRVARAAAWVGTTAAFAAIGAVVAGAVEARTADTIGEAVATIGFGAAATWPILAVLALIVRALWLGWNPRGLAAEMTDEHGSAPRLAGWLGYVLIACLLLSWATFNTIRLLASWTTFKPTIVAVITPPVVVATALGLIAGSRPIAGALGRGAAWIDRRCRARWKRSPFTPRALTIGAAVVLVAVGVVAWEISIKPRLGYIDLGILLHPAIAIVVAISAGVGARKLPPRARRIVLVAGAGFAAVTIGFALWLRIHEPLEVLQIWARPTVASEAIETFYELEDLRDDIAVMVDPPRLRPGAVPRDIVLITIDTVRADHTPVGGGQADMPTLARLGASGAVFTAAFSPGNVTRRSIPSIGLGVSPPRVRGKVAGWALRLDPRHVLVAERFRAAGYDTAGFFCCASFWGAYHKLGLDRGLDHVEIEPDGAKLSELARKWLLARRADPSTKRPLFLWVHFIEPHNWLQGQNPKTPADRSAQYDKVLAEVDRYAGIVVSAFQNAGEHTPIIAITADHGEALGDHGSPYHGTDLYDSQIHVPLVINGPDIPAHRVTQVVGLVGLAPTLLELAGYTPPGMPQLDGTSFAPLVTGPGPGDPDGGYAFSTMVKDRSVPDGMRAVIRGHWKLIETKHGFELYDRADDPREQHNLATSRTDMLAQMKQLLDGRRAIDGKSPFSSR